jgi:hypothetical protein
VDVLGRRHERLDVARPGDHLPDRDEAAAAVMVDLAVVRFALLAAVDADDAP